MPDKRNRQRFDQAVTAALADGLTVDELHQSVKHRAREEQERKAKAEAERLRQAGFVLSIELNGRGLWTHPKTGGSYWTEEALEMLRQESA
jgi:hypothetical protein